MGDLTTDAFAFWNASFCEKMSLTVEELIQVKFSGLIRFDEKNADQAPEFEDLQKVTTLLDAVIDAIVNGFEHSP